MYIIMNHDCTFFLNIFVSLNVNYIQYSHEQLQLKNLLNSLVNEIKLIYDHVTGNSR